MRKHDLDELSSLFFNHGVTTKTLWLLEHELDVMQVGPVQKLKYKMAQRVESGGKYFSGNFLEYVYKSGI